MLEAASALQLRACRAAVVVSPQRADARRHASPVRVRQSLQFVSRQHALFRLPRFPGRRAGRLWKAEKRASSAGVRLRAQERQGHRRARDPLFPPSLSQPYLQALPRLPIGSRCSSPGTGPRRPIATNATAIRRSSSGRAIETPSSIFPTGQMTLISFACFPARTTPRMSHGAGAAVGAEFWLRRRRNAGPTTSVRAVGPSSDTARCRGLLECAQQRDVLHLIDREEALHRLVEDAAAALRGGAQHQCAVIVEDDQTGVEEIEVRPP